MTVQVTLGGRAPRYRCKDHNHLTRNVAHVDKVVFAHVACALTHPRAYELSTPVGPEVDAEALRAEGNAIRGNLERMAEEEAFAL